MHVKLFKYISELVSYALTLLLNYSFRTGTFPNEQKSARTAKIFKSSDRSDPSRSYLGKALERCINNRLILYRKINNKVCVIVLYTHMISRKHSIQ